MLADIVVQLRKVGEMLEKLVIGHRSVFLLLFWQVNIVN
jgi:hypothetical protein